jgi:hypothetical protein
LEEAFKRVKGDNYHMARTAQKKSQAKSEGAKTIRQFKASSDVENFYRYVHENNFRQEAKAMLQAVQEVLVAEKKAKKAKRASKKAKTLH